MRLIFTAFYSMVLLASKFEVRHHKRVVSIGNSTVVVVVVVVATVSIIRVTVSFYLLPPITTLFVTFHFWSVFIVQHGHLCHHVAFCFVFRLHFFCILLSMYLLCGCWFVLLFLSTARVVSCLGSPFVCLFVCSACYVSVFTWCSSLLRLFRINGLLTRHKY